MNKNITETLNYLKKNNVLKPEIGIVLGTGLGKLATKIDVIETIDYKDIPNFPLSTVESHSGKLIYGKLNGRIVLAMQGRFHFYEGYTFEQLTFPIRIMKLLGVNFLLLSNAAGAMNLSFKKASLMLITDHINLLGSSPLIGKNNEDFGPRFPDMSKAYSPEINDKIEKVAKELDIPLNKGVYVAVAGPNLETPTEYRYLKLIGADIVGMSTVPEVIVANHMSLPCAAISVITDECDPDNLKEVDISEIIEVASRAEDKLIEIFMKLMEVI